MGYLVDFEHDIFVSYAHSGLDAWSRQLIEDIRGLVATGLGLRQADQVDLWMDYKISGHEPLTAQLQGKVRRSGLLIVLMSEWYLESSWCNDEAGWFVELSPQKRAGPTVFIVRVRPTDHTTWPKVFRDERGHPLVGYDFVRTIEPNKLGLPKGYPRPEDAPDSRAYHEEVSKLASGLVAELKALALSRQPRPPRPMAPIPSLAAVSANDMRPRPARSTPAMSPNERVCLAAAPVEDVDDLRDELAELLRRQGCTVVPESNPFDSDDVYQHAAEWIANCDKFVQVLGSVSGPWRHDQTGLVMYQHEIAKTAGKPIFVYRAPSVETSRVRKAEYREFLERFEQTEVGELLTFAEQVTAVAAAPQGGHRSVFMMASPRDESLEREIRRLLTELDIAVFPLQRSSGNREVASVLDESVSFLKVVRRCGAILLINGNVKQEDRLWIDERVTDIQFDIQPKLGSRLPYAIVDAPPDPLEPWEDVRVFSCDSPTLKHDLQGWLRTLKSSLTP